MAVVDKVISAPPQRVFEVLADGWSYSDWVVGTAHIRDVDDSWPSPGASIHHTSGPWPVSLRDKTTVISCEAPRRLVLCAGLWPLGTLTVTLTLMPLGAAGTRVTLAEETTAGPLRWTRNRLNDLVLHYRNREALNRLGDLATRKDPRKSPAQVAGTRANEVVNR